MGCRVRVGLGFWVRVSVRVSDPHAGVVGGVGVEADDQAAKSDHVDEDAQYKRHLDVKTAGSST